MSDCWASLRTNKRMFRPPGLFHSLWNESVKETLRSLMWASCQRCKELLEESWCSFYQPRVLCVFQEKASLSPPLGLDWEEEMATAQPHDCVPVASNHPLYVLYTSGTTGTPKVQQQRQMEITANDSKTHLHAEQLQDVLQKFLPLWPTVDAKPRPAAWFFLLIALGRPSI